MNARKYNILQVHNYYQIPGGEDSVVANEKKLLEEHGHKVIQYSRNNSELKTISKFQKILLPFTTIFNIKTYRDVKKIIKAECIDIVHVHNTLNLISPSVYYAAFACKVPVIQTIHNFRLLCPGATFYRDGHICEDCVSKGLVCAIKHNCYRNSKLQTLACVINTKIHRLLGTYGKLNYICLTEFNKEKLLELRQIKPKRVFVKPNFVENKDAIIPYEERENQYIYAGRLDKLKGVDLLIKAWKDMGTDAPKLLLCGTGPLETWCKKYIKNNNLNMIDMKGFVENQAAKKLIAESRALILPTQWYEGFPMTIVEAFSVGTPVIGSNIGNVGSIISENITGWKFQTNSYFDFLKTIRHTNNLVNSVYKEYLEKYSKHENYKILNKIILEISS